MNVCFTEPIIIFRCDFLPITVIVGCNNISESVYRVYNNCLDQRDLSSGRVGKRGRRTYIVLYIDLTVHTRRLSRVGLITIFGRTFSASSFSYHGSWRNRINRARQCECAVRFTHTRTRGAHPFSAKIVQVGLIILSRRRWRNGRTGYGRRARTQIPRVPSQIRENPFGFGEKRRRRRIMQMQSRYAGLRGAAAACWKSLLGTYRGKRNERQKRDENIGYKVQKPVRSRG